MPAGHCRYRLPDCRRNLRARTAHVAGGMDCPSYGSANLEGKKICGDCGAPLAVRCSACGAENPSSKRFCGDCGAALMPTGGAQVPPAAGASTPNVLRVTEPAARRRGNLLALNANIDDLVERCNLSAGELSLLRTHGGKAFFEELPRSGELLKARERCAAR